jgi:hypothetical protein
MKKVIAISIITILIVTLGTHYLVSHTSTNFKHPSLAELTSILRTNKTSASSSDSNFIYAKKLSEKLLGSFEAQSILSQVSTLPVSVAKYGNYQVSFSKYVAYHYNYFYSSQPYELVYRLLKQSPPSNCNPNGTGTVSKYDQVESISLVYDCAYSSLAISSAELITTVIPYQNSTFVSITSAVTYYPNRPTFTILTNKISKISLQVTDSSDQTKVTELTSALSKTDRSEISQIETKFNSLKPALYDFNPGGPSISNEVANEKVNLDFYSGPTIILSAEYSPTSELMGTGGISVAKGDSNNYQIRLSDPGFEFLNIISSITKVKFILN